MISTEKKFLFIHIPKTGGNSIQEILKPYSEDEVYSRYAHQDGVERFAVRNATLNTHKHSALSEYKAALPADLYRALFRFSVIRNPWDRLISYYFSPSERRAHWDRDEFAGFIDSIEPASHYLCLPERARSNDHAGKRGLIFPDMDFLIRFEHIDEDFRQVCEHLDLPFRPLPARNRSTHEHYSTYYDRELIERVEHRFRDEICFGNYRFETA